MARTISMASDAWTTMRLDPILDPDSAEFRNETDSGYGDDEGEWFAVAESVKLADGSTYHVLFHGTHSNDHSPFTMMNTWATLYRADHSAETEEFRAEVERWESMPERLDSGDDEDCVPDCEPHGVEVNSIDTLGEDDSEDDIPAPDGWDAIDTSAEDDVPNLDAMDADELREFSRAIRTREDITPYTRENLCSYAIHRLDAMAHRLAGRIEAAIHHEHRMQAIYNVLPVAYRW